MVSHCVTHSDREFYVKELQKYIQVKHVLNFILNKEAGKNTMLEKRL